MQELSSKGQIPLRYLVRSWSQTGSKPNSLRYPGRRQVRTSFEPDNVMEFGFKQLIHVDLLTRLQHALVTYIQQIHT